MIVTMTMINNDDNNVNTMQVPAPRTPPGSPPPPTHLALVIRVPGALEATTGE